MLRKNALRIAAIGVAAASLVGTSAFSAAAATDNGSDGIYYIYDAGNETLVAPGAVNLFDDEVVGAPKGGNTIADARSPFTCAADAETVQTFIAPVGQEKVRSAWVAYADSGFAPGTKTILEPSANLQAQILGLPGAGSVKAAGGNYSLGVACEINNNVALASAGIWFAPITVTAGTGSWTYALSTGGGPVTPVDPSLTFDQTIQATTIAGVDGVLTLSAPASATTVLGAAALEGGQSKSTGNVGTFTVKDGRVVTHKGWTVTTSVSDFTNTADGTVKIDKKQLGIEPLAVGTKPAGVTLSPATIAGSAVNPAPFAQADATTAIAATDLDAKLTFVAPGDKPAGTYTSKLTITLSSK